MAEDNLFKNETLEESRERLRALSAAEKEGFEAASEGQAVPDRNPPELQERAAQVDQKFDAVRDINVEEGTNRPAAEGVQLLQSGGVRPAEEEPSEEPSRPEENEPAPVRRRGGRRGAQEESGGQEVF